MSLVLVPVTQREAFAFIARNHRHHRPPRGSILCIGAAERTPEGLAVDGVVGVAVVGRPLARELQDGWTAEVTRVATDGARNACSFLYGACWRACRAVGFRRLVTYTLPEEGGGFAPCSRLAPDRRSRRRLMVTYGKAARRPPSNATQAPLGSCVMNRTEETDR